MRGGRQSGTGWVPDVGPAGWVRQTGRVDSPVGYLVIVSAVVIAALLLAVLARFASVSRAAARSRLGTWLSQRLRARQRLGESALLEIGFPGLADFATAHGWSGPRDDLALDREEIATVADLSGEPSGHVSLVYACTGHYRGMSVMVGNATLAGRGPDAADLGVVVVTLPYLLPRRHSVHAEPAVADAIGRRDDWALRFASGRLTCVRTEPFRSVADVARTLDGLAEVVSAVPAELVARFTVVLPRLPDGRLSDPHDEASMGDALESMSPAQRRAFLDQMRGLRRSKPRGAKPR